METLVVVSLIIIAISFNLYFDFDNFRTYSFNSDKDTLISALEHARMEAIANVCRGSGCKDGRAHGVAVRPADNPDKYVIFQSGEPESDYAHRDASADATLDANENITISGNINEVVFSPIEGSVTVAGDIILTDEKGHASTITINSEGQITWTN